MRLVVYEKAECYRVVDSVNRTKMVSQLERRFSPYLDVHHCFTVDNPRYELTIKGDTINKNFDNLQEDYAFLASKITPNLPHNEHATMSMCGSYADAKRAQKPFHCPGLKQNDDNRPRHDVYRLLHTGGYLKPVSDDARKEAIRQVCSEIYGTNTDLYDYCVSRDNLEHFDAKNTPIKGGISREIKLIGLVVLCVIIVYLVARAIMKHKILISPIPN